MMLQRHDVLIGLLSCLSDSRVFFTLCLRAGALGGGCIGDRGIGVGHRGV